MSGTSLSRWKPADERVVGGASAALAALLFGSAYVATAIQLRDVSPLGGALWRSAVALGILLVIAWTRRPFGSSTTRPGVPWTAARLGPLLLLGVLGGFVFIVGMNEAISHVGATVTAFVAGLYAVLAALFAPLVLAERVEPRAFVGFALALVGTALLAELDLSGAALAGLAAGMVAAVSYALYLVLIRRWSREIDVGPVGISIATASASAVGLAALIGATDPRAALPSATGLSLVLSTIWLGIVTAFGPLLATAALRRVEASLASSLLLLNPISATILAVILLGEWPSAVQALGGILVLVGIGLATGVSARIRRRRNAASRARPLARSGDVQ